MPQGLEVSRKSALGEKVAQDSQRLAEVPLDILDRPAMGRIAVRVHDELLIRSRV
jgi:hypothetical protein